MCSQSCIEKLPSFLKQKNILHFSCRLVRMKFFFCAVGREQSQDFFVFGQTVDLVLLRIPTQVALIYFKNEVFSSCIRTVRRAQWRISHHFDAVVFAEFNKSWLLQIRMNLVLIYNWFYLCETKHLLK